MPLDGQVLRCGIIAPLSRPERDSPVWGNDVRFSPRLGLIAFAAATLPLTACGGGGGADKVDVEDWVADVCDRAIDFDDDLLAAADDLSVIEDGDPDEIKDAIDTFADDASDLMDDFIKDVEKIGQPDIDGGADVLKAFKQHAADEKKQISKLKKDVKDINERNEDDFRDEVISLFEDIEDLNLRDKLEDIGERDVDDLIDMIDDDSDCAAALFSDS